VDHLERIIDASGVVPSVNQIELHPQLQQTRLREYHAEQGIASDVGRTPAQVVLRWHVQLGNVVIPKSVTPERIEENFELFDFELSEEQMDAIGQLETGERTGPDPDTLDAT
jgi:2,5-diketo-D-gluconate reductase A